MSRSTANKKTPPTKRERRRTPRAVKSRTRQVARTKDSPDRTKASASAAAAAAAEESCRHCSKRLQTDDRALFVEEEIGRVFCSEECITGYFTPDVERLEKEYFRLLTPGDLTPEEREKLAHLRWITLQEPDEAWRQKSLSGDHRYTLISEFRPATRSIWCVCICLFLRGEPSFLFISLTTKNAAMVNHYRRGERVRIETAKSKKSASAKAVSASETADTATAEPPMAPTDGLASEWTDEETRRAQMNQARRSDDIPESEFELYQACLEETLQSPTEVWAKSEEALDADSEAAEPTEPTEPGEGRIFHFIRFYPEETPGMWYVVTARELDDSEEIEILDAFPTRDSDLVDRYRSGTQEVGDVGQPASARLVH